VEIYFDLNTLKFGREKIGKKAEQIRQSNKNSVSYKIRQK